MAATIQVLALVLLAGVGCTASPARIVGGTAISIDNIPSLIQVEFLGRNTGTWSQACAGNILTSLHVLSAAHCFDGWTFPSAEYRRIRAGSATRESGGDLYNVLWVSKHPTYGTNGYDGDIAVVRMTATITLSSTVAIGTIVIQDWEAPDGTAVTHAGWGSTQQGGEYSDVLLQTTNNIVNLTTCREQHQAAPWPRPVTDNMICTGTQEGGRDACNGDEGGAIYLGGIIIGVVSWGQGCALPEYPGVVTKVSAYTNWIRATATS